MSAYSLGRSEVVAGLLGLEKNAAVAGRIGTLVRKIFKAKPARAKNITVTPHYRAVPKGVENPYAAAPRPVPKPVAQPAAMTPAAAAAPAAAPAAATQTIGQRLKKPGMLVGGLGAVGGLGYLGATMDQGPQIDAPMAYNY